MKFEVSVEEYENAVRAALDLVDANAGSHRAEAMELVLAGVWDTLACANTLDCLGVMDRSTQRIALCLIVGRTYCGRPSGLGGTTTALEDVFHRVYRRQNAASPAITRLPRRP